MVGRIFETGGFIAGSERVMELWVMRVVSRCDRCGREEVIQSEMERLGRG